MRVVLRGEPLRGDAPRNAWGRVVFPPHVSERCCCSWSFSCALFRERLRHTKRGSVSLHPMRGDFCPWRQSSPGVPRKRRDSAWEIFSWKWTGTSFPARLPRRSRPISNGAFPEDGPAWSFWCGMARRTWCGSGEPIRPLPSSACSTVRRPSARPPAGATSPGRRASALSRECAMPVFPESLSPRFRKRRGVRGTASRGRFSGGTAASRGGTGPARKGSTLPRGSTGPSRRLEGPGGGGNVLFGALEGLERHVRPGGSGQGERKGAPAGSACPRGDGCAVVGVVFRGGMRKRSTCGVFLRGFAQEEQGGHPGMESRPRTKEAVE